MGPEGSFPLVTFGDLDEVIHMPQINFRIDVSFPRGIEKVRMLKFGDDPNTV